MSPDAPDDSEAFVAEACWHYYVNEMTQAEVAALLGATRLRVNQAIRKAKALGMVKIQIESPFLARIELQQALRETLGIRKALVAPAPRDAYDYHVPVGAALASHLSQTLKAKQWKRIGVSWGMTLQSAADRLPRHAIPDLEIVSMIGGAVTGASFNSFGIASGFAERLGSKYSLLAAPIYLSEGVDRDQFLAQRVFREHFRKCGTLDAALLVAGDISCRSYLISTGLPEGVRAEELAAMGAVGDVLGRFLDEDGNDVPSPLTGRTVGIDLDVLKSIPERILAAAGPHKVRIIRAAARRGLVDTLITDDVTAELLIGAGGA
jgi:DNA-binding transcriptional regulator LsrR (DeoR family)